MAKSVQRKTDRSPEEVARLRELRERYQREKPSIADLEAFDVKHWESIEAELAEARPPDPT